MMNGRFGTLGTVVGSLIALAASVGADEVDQRLEEERLSQTATAITIIFDNSGSMKADKKILQAKRAFSAWLAQLPDSYRLGLIHFQGGKGKVAVDLGEENREKVNTQVNKLGPYGKTPICDCLRLASAQISKRRTSHSPYERHVIVVFTDGAETVDRRQNRGVVDDVKRLREAGIEVVGIGFHGEGDYMKSAVTRYFAAGNEEELKKGLAKVDAEVGDDSGIEVTETDIKLMQSLDIPLPRVPSS